MATAGAFDFVLDANCCGQQISVASLEAETQQRAPP